MALKKKLIFDNGVKINYHMIDDIQVDNKNKTVKLKVASYTDKTYRDKEVENEFHKNKYKNYMDLINLEIVKDLIEDHEEAHELSIEYEKIRNLEDEVSIARKQEIIDILTNLSLIEVSGRNIPLLILNTILANCEVGKFIENIQLKVVTTDIELKEVYDFNSSNLYNLLKKEELFLEAEDC